MDSVINAVDKSFLEKLQLYLENYPGRCCDVSFVVGSGEEKEIIQTSRIILEIVCPEFMKLFDENWGQAVAVARNQESGINEIPLSDVDPKAFKIFLKLLLLDDVSVDSLSKFSVSSKDILNVIELCERYKMPKIQKNLEIIAQDTLLGRGFSAFAKTDEFLTLSQRNLNTVLHNDNLDASETEILEATMRWAEKRCCEENIENTGENIREVLGDSFFRIRFPAMSSKEFATNIRLRSILTLKEQVELMRYIITREQAVSMEELNLAFHKIERVRGAPIKTLRLLNGFKIVNDPPFKCDGLVRYCLCVKVSQEVEVFGVGFLGPIDSDSFYEVTLEIKEKENIASFGKLQKRVFAQKNEIFYVSFDKPIKMNATYVQDNWNSAYYLVYFSLKGPNTSVCQLDSSNKDFPTKTDDGIGLYCKVYNNLPFVEIRYKKC